jgi:hypothetical protein
MTQFTAEVFDPVMLDLRGNKQKKPAQHRTDGRQSVFNWADSSDSESDEDEKLTFSFSKLLKRGGTESHKKAEESELPSSSRTTVVEDGIARNVENQESWNQLNVSSDKRQVRKNSLADASQKFKDLLMPPNMQRRGSTASESSEKSPTTLSRSSSEISLEEKFGQSECVLGKGAYATVKLYCGKSDTRQKFAVKQFRKRKHDESMVDLVFMKKDYIKKLNAEFSIAITLNHENVVKCFDRIQDHVLEYPKKEQELVLCNGVLSRRRLIS